MSSFLDELKQKLKSGSANAELKIVTNGHKPQQSSTGIQWGKILGILGAVAVIVMLIVGIMLFLNNQKEKNLNVINDTPALLQKNDDEKDDNQDDPITDLNFEQVTTASERIQEKKPPANTDPNFTLLSELL